MTRVASRAAAGLVVAASLAADAHGQTLDRSKRPAAPPPPAFTFPAVQSRTLPNGLSVRIVENRALPLVAVRVFIEGGSLLDPAGREGLFTLDTLLLRDATTSKTAAQIALATDEVGATVWPTRFTAVSGAFEKGLALLGDMLMHPAFPAAAVESRKAQLVNTMQRAEGTASTPALRIFNATLWGATHPFARVASPASIGAITRDEIEQFHRKYVRPENVTLTIVGDVSTASAMAAVTKVFGGWERGGERVRIAAPETPAPKPTTIYLYDRRGSTQSTIFVGQVAPSRSTPDFFALETMGALFGGPTGSRLTMSLRERRPLTYSVSHLPVWRRVGDPSSFHGSANVDAKRTDSALVVWLDEIRDLAGRRPPADSELAFARAVTVGRLLTRLETIDSVANRLNLVARDGLPATFYDEYIRGMNRVTAANVKTAAAKVVDPAHTTIVVVGDRKVVEPVLRAANIAPVVIVGPDGAVKP